VIFSVAMAIAAAITYGLSTVLQGLAVRRAIGLAVVRQPLVILSIVLDLGGWLLSLVALDRLPLFVVQAVLASSLAVVVVVARPVLGVHLRRLDALAVVVVVSGLVVLGLAGGEQMATSPPSGFARAMIVAAIVIGGATALLYRSGPTVVMAAVAGLGFGVAALSARALHAGGGLLAILGQPLSIAIVVAGAAGGLGYLRALERGSIGAVAAVVSVVEVIIPGALGIAILGDGVRGGWAVPAGVAIVMALAGIVVLACSPAHRTAAAASVAPTVTT